MTIMITDSQAQQLLVAFTAALAASGIVVQQPQAEAPAKRPAQPEFVEKWVAVTVDRIEIGDVISRYRDGAHSRTVTDIVRRANGTIMLAVEGNDDCKALILEPTRVMTRQTFDWEDALVYGVPEAPKVSLAKPEPKAPKGKKGRYSQPATKVQLRVVFDKAAGADYGTVAQDCKSEDGIVLARKGEPLDMVLNNLRSYNQEADDLGAPIYGFNIVGRNGTAVKAASLAAARKASANR